MRVSASLVRFVLEAAFIVAVAAATAVARLDKIWIAVAVGGAWALVTLVERGAKQGRGFGLRRHFSRRQRAEAAPEHPEPEPSTPEPEPHPEPAPPAPEPQPPRPEPEQPTPQLRAVEAPPPEPDLQPEPEPEPEPQVVRLRLRDGAPREWNVWELERVARDHEGEDAARDEELTFLLLELRQFANADGQLPVSFDPVVREAFGESIYSQV